MLTVGSVLTSNVLVSQNQSVPAFVQSYSQSQARLMFVTTLGMDSFDCIKMNAHFKKFTAGGANSRVEASITCPTSPPHVAKQLTALFHTQPPFSSFGCWSVAPTTNCVFSVVKASLAKPDPSSAREGLHADPEIYSTRVIV